MTKNVASSAKLIWDTCAAQRLCCQICESFSIEAGIPHFRDLIHGVWSSSPGRFDPFRSPDDAMAIRQWFAWRLALMSRVTDSPSYLALARLQKSLSMLMATECVDALADQAGLTGLLRLNGSVHEFRCFDCGWTPVRGELGSRGHLCQRCSGELWPDVPMFGRNAQEAVRSIWMQHLSENRVHVFIGMPEVPPKTSRNSTVLTVGPEGLHMTARSGGVTLRTEALEGFLSAHLAKAVGARERADGLNGLPSSARTHRSLLALCRLIDLGPTL